MNKFSIKKPYVIGFILVVTFFYLGTHSSQNQPPPTPNAKPGKCLVVEDKYCGTYKLIKSPFSEENNSFVAFNLPKGAVIFAPVDGYITNDNTFDFLKKNKNTYPGQTISVPDSNIESAQSFYAFSYFELNSNSSRTVKKGEKIGTVSDKEISDLGNYNLIFYILDRKSAKEDLAKLNQLFK